MRSSSKNRSRRKQEQERLTKTHRVMKHFTVTMIPYFRPLVPRKYELVTETYSDDQREDMELFYLYHLARLVAYIKAELIPENYKYEEVVEMMNRHHETFHLFYHCKDDLYLTISGPYYVPCHPYTLNHGQPLYTVEVARKRGDDRYLIDQSIFNRPQDDDRYYFSQRGILEYRCSSYDDVSEKLVLRLIKKHNSEQQPTICGIPLVKPILPEGWPVNSLDGSMMRPDIYEAMKSENFTPDIIPFISFPDMRTKIPINVTKDLPKGMIYSEELRRDIEINFLLELACKVEKEKSSLIPTYYNREKISKILSTPTTELSIAYKGRNKSISVRAGYPTDSIPAPRCKPAWLVGPTEYTHFEVMYNWENLRLNKEQVLDLFK